MFSEVYKKFINKEITQLEFLDFKLNELYKVKQETIIFLDDIDKEISNLCHMIYSIKLNNKENKIECPAQI